jgi:hypothetical protein
MTKTIARLFDDFDDARAAVAELEATGIAHAGISIVNGGPGPVPATPADMTGHEMGGFAGTSGEGDGLVGALIQAGVSEADAHVYAEGVQRGGTLVMVHEDDDAEAVLRRHRGVGAADHGAAHRTEGRTASADGERNDGEKSPKGEGYSISDDPAPLSHLLHVPVLTED